MSGPEDYLWLVILGGFSAFITAFGIGSNDVANSFASSVGSKTLKLWQAVIIAGIFEFSGAVLLGAGVTNTIRNGIGKVEIFEDNPQLLMLGMLCADLGAGAWILIASRLELAVSTTHSIVGAIIGIFLVAGGPSAVDWFQVGMIVVSWFSSPIITGIIAGSLFLFCRFFILRSENSFSRARKFYPFLVSFTVAINLFFIIYKGAPGLGGDKTPAWMSVVIAIGSGIVIGLIIHFIVVPLLVKRLDKWVLKKQAKEDAKKLSQLEAQDIELRKTNSAKTELIEISERTESSQDTENSQDSETSQDNEKQNQDQDKNENENQDSLPQKEVETTQKLEPVELKKSAPPKKTKPTLKEKMDKRIQKQLDLWLGRNFHERVLEDDDVREMHDKLEKFEPKTEEMFSYLQVFTAIFASFAHGASDVSNSVAPLATIYTIYHAGGIPTESQVPVWVLALGGFGIVVGLALYGYRMMAALGMKLTLMTPSRGFSVELGTAFTVLVFSMVAVPISSTQCIIGSLAAVGFISGGFEGTNKRLLFKTFFSWIITLVVAGSFSAALFSFTAFSPTIHRGTI